MAFNPSISKNRTESNSRRDQASQWTRLQGEGEGLTHLVEDSEGEALVADLLQEPFLFLLKREPLRQLFKGQEEGIRPWRHDQPKI